jgi:predicted Ser/Thr protein kinase
VVVVGGVSGDDPHAETALAGTMGTSEGGAVRPSAPLVLPRQLGRFRLERELGRGGMGAVYAARDPELERTVAIKVLRDAGGPDARARLVREARAMAKLAHPNVITVFEAGTADDHDYIAMELVDGETLAARLTRGRQRWRDVLRVFIAAGRGLAAAHAAGLVHRDFKPSNVLCGRDGRVVVTDFGLARRADSMLTPADEGGTLDDLYRTQTGLVLGTPAYMAPEQWTADTVGAASDQFAFCVALWEALAGERPFRGDSREELRKRVLAGDAQVAETRGVPGALRSIVRRGLAAEPARRWPSMAALIAALERRLALRRRVALAAAAGGFSVLGLGAALMFVGRAKANDTNPCPGPYDPNVVWAPARASAIAARHPGAARLIATDIASWRSIREQVCASSGAARAPQIACLDGVLARIAALATDLEHATASSSDGAADILVEPSLCQRTPAPRLLTAIDPPLAAALVALRRRYDGERAPVPQNQEPCASTVATIAELEHPSATTGAMAVEPVLDAVRQLARSSARCDDDAIRVQAAFYMNFMRETGAVERFEEAVRMFPTQVALGHLELMRGEKASDNEAWDEADRHITAAVEHFTSRHAEHALLDAVFARMILLLARGLPADLRTVRELASHYRATTRSLGSSMADRLDHYDAVAQWQLGDVLAADRTLVKPTVNVIHVIAGKQPPRDISGIVVDESNVPIPGAEVTAGTKLISDTAVLSTPLEDIAPGTVTDAAGRFELHGVVGTAAARRGDRRGTGESRIVLHPTTTVAGHVTLADPAIGRIHVVVRGRDYIGVAPVREDGRYELANVPRGALAVEVLPSHVVATNAPAQVTATTDHTTVDLVARRFRPLHILARTPDLQAPQYAMIWVLPRPKPALRSLLFEELLRHGVRLDSEYTIASAQVPAAMATRARADDLYARIDDRPGGEVTLCASAFNMEHVVAMSTDRKRLDRMVLACTTIDATTELAVVELPPLRRVDD